MDFISLAIEICERKTNEEFEQLDALSIISTDIWISFIITTHKHDEEHVQ